MHFLTAASTLLALTLAAPTPQTTDCPNPAHCGTQAPDPSTYENINISSYYLRKNNGIQSVSFKLSGNNATDLVCETGAVPTLPSADVACGDSKYSFQVVESPSGGSEPGLVVIHETGLAFGFWGTGEVPTYCHAGGNGPDDFVCAQVSATTIVITASG